MSRAERAPAAGCHAAAVVQTVVALTAALRVEWAVQRTRGRAPARLRLTVAGLCKHLGVRLSLVGPAAAAGTPQAELPAWCEPRVRAVDRVMTRWPLGDTCLRRSLVLARRLAALDPVLRLGPSFTADDELVGHAWLEVDGRPVGEPGLGPLALPS